MAIPSPSIFRHRDFTCFIGARFLSNLAVQAQAVTIGWQVYNLARVDHSIPESAFLVGMVGLVQFLPLFALTLIAGATADRHDRRKLALICLVGDFLIVGALALLALDPQPSLVPIFALAACFGVGRAFMGPAVTAIGPMLVPRDELPRAVAMTSLAYQSAAIIGPAIGGFLLIHSSTAAYGGAAVAYAGATFLMGLIRTHTRPERQPGSRVAQIKEGLAYVWTNKIVLGAISLDLFAVLLGGTTALLPVFARDVLHVGTVEFGFLRAGPAIGAASVALLLSIRPIRRRAGLWMFGGVAAFGLATIAFALSRWWPLSIVALAVLGAGDMLSVFVRQSLMQIVTPDHMRGRVAAVSYLFIGASNELGEFETGIAARILGPVGAALFGGIGSLVVTGTWAWMFPSLRKADRLLRPEEPTPSA
jgi:MFS family permease